MCENSWNMAVVKVKKQILRTLFLLHNKKVKWKVNLFYLTFVVMVLTLADGWLWRSPILRANNLRTVSRSLEYLAHFLSLVIKEVRADIRISVVAEKLAKLFVLADRRCYHVTDFVRALVECKVSAAGKVKRMAHSYSGHCQNNKNLKAQHGV